MSGRKKLRIAILGVVVIVFSLIIADSLGVFSTKPYVEISHGDHSHYVPRDREPGTPVTAFPTRPPTPNERITPTGQIVPKDAPRK